MSGNRTSSISPTSSFSIPLTLLTLLLFFATTTVAFYPASTSTPTALTRISFGSCSKTWLKQPTWKPILEYNPELFVWLGDVVYNDIPVLPGLFKMNSLENMKENYRLQHEMEGYKELRANTPIVGVWDDHESINDGGGAYPYKKENQQLFMDFLDIPAGDPSRAQEGLYSSYSFGEAPHQIKVILLDGRYFKNSTTFLGEVQWDWLRHELQSNEASLTLIGSGVQVIPDDKPFENWAAISNERKRLLSVLAETQASGVILLSGDVHYTQTYRLPASCSPTGYPLHEFTSSGMTHSCSTQFGKYFCEHVATKMITSRFQDSPFFMGKNFGTLDVDWDRREVTFHSHDHTGAVVIEKVVRLDDLIYSDSRGDGAESGVAPYLNPSCHISDTRKYIVHVVTPTRLAAGTFISLGLLSLTLLICFCRRTRVGSKKVKEH
eukprot:TRINITY_DN10994_c0_g1_i1.p1 TRINITY_DN10994_c0_g1~~TRINITY_DN10994_c0_g1_i1.p1  ORF type:complete len:457 (+),score=63.09 TRINITY_DN10994_c0_g1_i1:65-1372(+)